MSVLVNLFFLVDLFFFIDFYMKQPLEESKLGQNLKLLRLVQSDHSTNLLLLKSLMSEK